MTKHEFEQIFLPLRRTMYWAAWRMCGSREEAEDIVQEALARLWSKREELPAIGSDEAYCIKIVKRMCIDRHRIRRPQTVSIDSTADNPDSAQYTSCGNQSALIADDNIEERINNSQMAELIKAQILSLPPQMRLIITLKDIDDRDYHEIATLTGLREANIRMIVSRARKEIRKRFTRSPQQHKKQ